MGTETEPVVVVGAGPVGMSAALALRARGLPVTVLEADAEDRERPGSRAIYVHGATLRTLERNRPGLGQTLAERGLVWPTRKTFWHGKEVFARTYSSPGGSGGLPHFISMPQVWTEAELLGACRETGVEIRWETPVETVESGPEGVSVSAENGVDVAADYVVGADGAESVVRKQIGADFEGDRSKNHFVITDVDEHPDTPRANERIFHYGHPDIDGRHVLLVPFSGGWRVDLQCRPSDDPERLSREDVVSEWVAATLGERYADRVDWISTYQFLQVTADSFIDEHRRVLLAGEAAHLFAPFGARGMNSGIADAEAAASAIAIAQRAEHDGVARQAVEKFAAERETAAEWNKNAAGQALRHMQADDPVLRLKQRLAAAVAPVYEPAGKWLDEAPYGPRGGPPIVTGDKY